MPLATVIYTITQDRTAFKLNNKNMDRITIGEKSAKTYEKMREELYEKENLKVPEDN